MRANLLQSLNSIAMTEWSFELISLLLDIVIFDVPNHRFLGPIEITVSVKPQLRFDLFQSLQFILDSSFFVGSDNLSLADTNSDIVDFQLVPSIVDKVGVLALQFVL